MSYETDEVVRVARAHHIYLESLLTHALSFPINEWMDKGRHAYLGSERYLGLTSAYEESVPAEVREQLRPDVEFFLKRILDPKYAGDIQFDKRIAVSVEEPDRDDGND